MSNNGIDYIYITSNTVDNSGCVKIKVEFPVDMHEDDYKDLILNLLDVATVVKERLLTRKQIDVEVVSKESIEAVLKIVIILKRNSMLVSDHAGFVHYAGLESALNMLKNGEHGKVAEFYNELIDYIGADVAHKLLEIYTNT